MKLVVHVRAVAIACLAAVAGCDGWLSDGPAYTDAGAAGGSPSQGPTGGGGETTGTGGGAAGTGGGTAGGGSAQGHSGGGVGSAECSDGIDNDGDGLVDWQYDLGCANGADADEAAGPREQEAGFTTYDVGADSLVIHVSSTGNDANDGRSPTLAVKTLARAAALVRDGKNDFLLLRRGDVWRGQSLGRFKSGQDAAHPLVVASYGESTARPRLEVSGQFIDHDGQARNHVAVIGLEIVPFSMIPGDPDYDGATSGGFRYVGGGKGLLIEDCHLLYGDLVVQSYGAEHYDGVEIRRNVIERAYHVDTCGQSSTYRPSGLYASHAVNLTIEENVFDHNGWNEEVSSACASMYNHNMYLNADGLVVRNNIIARAASMGIKMRSDVTGDADEMLFENNLLVDGEIGLGIGGNTAEPGRFSNATIRHNVFSQIGLGNPTARSFSWMLEVEDNVHATIDGNYFLHQPWYTNAYGILLGGGSASDLTVSGNVFYDLKARSLKVQAAPTNWANVMVRENTFVDPGHDSCLVDHAGGFAAVTYEANAYQGSGGDTWFCVDGARRTLAQWRVDSKESTASVWTGAFAAPQRTVGAYAETLGLAGTLGAFLEAARQQSRLTWRADLTAAAVNDYLRAGFR